MRNTSFLFFFILLNTVSFAQNFKQNSTDTEKDSKFLEKIAASKKYTLVGDFFVVQKKPEIKYAKVFIQYKGWGYIDSKGNEVIEPKYQFLTDFYDGFCKASFFTNRKHPQTGRMQQVLLYGLLDIDGNLITKNDYDGIEFTKNYIEPVTKPYTTIVIRRNGKVGMLDKSGHEIIAPDFDEIYDFVKLIAIKNGNKWGFTKPDGSLEPEFLYKYITCHKNFIFGETEKGRVMIDPETGKQMSDEVFDANYNISDYDNNEMGFPFSEAMDFLVLKQKDHFVLMSKSGKKIAQAKYMNKSSANYYTFRNRSKVGLMDGKGKIVLDTIYKSVGALEDKIPSFWANLDDKTIWFNKDFKPLKTNNSQSHYRNGRNIFFDDEKHKFGIQDEKGKVLTEPIYDNINAFEYYFVSVAATENHRKQGLLDRNGKIVLPFIYDGIYYYGNLHLNKIQKDEKYGLINLKGKITIPPIYDSLENIIDSSGNWEHLYLAQYRNTYQLVDENNKTIITDIKGGFSEVKQAFSQQRRVYQYSELRNSNLFGLKSKEGAIIISPEFERISNFHNGFALAQKPGYKSYRNTPYYLIDTFGNTFYFEDNQQSKGIIEYYYLDQFNYNQLWYYVQ